MSVEADDLVSEVWTRWQGHVINGAFPLGRYLGGSDHSGVFLTRSAGRPAEVAIKLVPTNRALAESQLPRWKRAGGLTHPHLLRLLEWGGCQLDGLPYLYTVMEYADQTLAQLLLNRALTDDEAREMLPPLLDALAFLHGRNLLQGQLKPSNVLVVGDQLKLASDTVRRASEAPMSTSNPTVYDPPEARHGASSTAGDIWALGVSLFEALTRRQPSGLGEPREVVLPGDFSPTFRDVVARCLRPVPQQRPHAIELMSWVQGSPSERPAIIEAAADVPAEPPTTEPAEADSSTAQPTTSQPTATQASTTQASASRASTTPSSTAGPAKTQSDKLEPPQVAATPVAVVPPKSAPPIAQYPKPQRLITMIVAALVLLALGWILVRALSSHRTNAQPPSSPQVPAGSQPEGAAAPSSAGARTPDSALSTASAARGEVQRPPSALHEVMPEVSQTARRTIRGHLKVWIRVIVEQDGSVFAATPDRGGPSRYFERLAVEAARQWTFQAVDAPPRRIMQLRFDFTRDGVTARAVAVH
jgi:serine/threonine protein kinase